jgi:hypothetical protein
MKAKRFYFTEEQLRNIEQRYQNGETPLEIAKSYDCSRDVIRNRLIERKVSLKKAGQNKVCIICSAKLDSSNTTWYRQKNYIYKCNECIKTEKAIQANEARKRDPGLSAERCHRHHVKLKNSAPKKYTSQQMRSSAKKRADALCVPYDLDAKYIESICPDICPIFKIELKFGGGNKGKNSASLDRIKPSLGYVKGNVRVISYLANLMKNEASDEELILFAKWILKKK